jgi:hypothetical protein
MTRRSFLRGTAVSGALLGLAALVGRHLTGYAVDPAIAGRLRALTPKEYVVLGAIARRISASDEPDAPLVDDEALLFVDRYVAGLDEGLRGDLRALLHLVEHASGLSRFSRMPDAERDAVLAGWQSSRLTVRRQGLQALRALTFLAYYRDPRTFPLIGYSGPMLPRPR